MSNDTFAAALVLAAIPVGMASSVFGVWLVRTVFSSLAGS